MNDAEVTELEQRLAAMTEREVADAYNRAEVGSKEADIIAGEMEPRNIGD